MAVEKCFSRAHYCPVCAGQPSVVLYTTGINNILLESVHSFVALVGGVQVNSTRLVMHVLIETLIASMNRMSFLRTPNCF